MEASIPRPQPEEAPAKNKQPQPEEKVEKKRAGISREELYKEVWNETMTDLGTRTMDMHIAKLRSKIEQDSAEPQIIKTVRGAGYKYESTQ